MATYQVSLVGSSHEIIGLAPECAMSDEATSTLLIFHYPEGDIDTRMRNAEMMHAALYDIYQCHDGIEEGDRFVTEFGNFVCVGMHVVPESPAETILAQATEAREALLDWQGDCQD